MPVDVTCDDIKNIVRSVNENEKDEGPVNKKLKTHHFQYKNYSQDFILDKPTYTQQYSDIYNLRIKKMRGLLLKTIEEEKKKNVANNEQYVVLQHLKEIKVNEKCFCIGTLFKKMNLRPSILNEYISSAVVDSENNKNGIVNFTHEEDVIFIEDETARLKLEGNINYDDYVTGLTVIVKGSGMSNGSLCVHEILFSYLPKLHIPSPVTIENRYILFVSGLNIKESVKNIESVSLLRNFILGISGDKQISSHLLRVVILGNSLSNIMEDEKETDIGTETPSGNKNGNETEAKTKTETKTGAETASGTDIENKVNDMDLFIASISSAVHIDLMPGDKDPSDISLPQQPFPNLLFKKSQNFSSFQCVTNPYMFSIDNINICCMSGEPVNNICAYSKNGNIEALQLIAKSRILSPTSPDTLGCYPFTEQDPFCLCNDDTYPHIFVSGNSESLEVTGLVPAPSLAAPVSGETLEVVKLPLLICLPSFNKIPKVVIVNLKNLDHKILSFEVDI